MTRIHTGVILALSFVCLMTTAAEAQRQRNGVWLGSDAQKGNPHGLAPAVLHRPPRECVDAMPNPGRGVYEPPSWPNDTIPFVFAPNTSGSQRIAMLAAMGEVTRKTRVKFVQRGLQQDYIYIQDSDRNSSFVGRIGGGQNVNIFNWNFEFIMVHELMHAVGIWHEQSASDRDNFVTIVPSNIQPDALHNFDIRPNANLTSFYDYLSVMHYRDNAFAIDPSSPTIITADPAFQDEIGQREFISEGDTEALQAMHGPPVPTEWINFLFNNPFLETGDFEFPWTTFAEAVAAAPGGTQTTRIINIYGVFDNDSASPSNPLVINKNVVIDGAFIAIE